MLGVRSIQQIRDEAKLTVDGEVAKVQAELDHTKREIDDSAAKTKKSVQDELNSAHTEVARRVDAEFRTDQITSLVQSVAKQRTEQELNGVIRSEVVKGIDQESGTIKNEVVIETQKAVKALEPDIAQIVHGETEKQVTASVDPVRKQMKDYGDTINFNTLATLAKNGDRKSFDILNNRSTYVTMPNALPLADTIANDIVRQYVNTLRMGRQFQDTPTSEQIKELMEYDADVNTRLTALDQFPAGDHSVVPILVRIIQNDSNLQVVYTAFLVMNRETGQHFRFPNYFEPLQWWEKNKEHGSKGRTTGVPS